MMSKVARLGTIYSYPSLWISRSTLQGTHHGFLHYTAPMAVMRTGRGRLQLDHLLLGGRSCGGNLSPACMFCERTAPGVALGLGGMVLTLLEFDANSNKSTPTFRPLVHFPRGWDIPRLSGRPSLSPLSRVLFLFCPHGLLPRRPNCWVLADMIVGY